MNGELVFYKKLEEYSSIVGEDNYDIKEINNLIKKLEELKYNKENIEQFLVGLFSYECNDVINDSEFNLILTNEEKNEISKRLRELYKSGNGKKAKKKKQNNIIISKKSLNSLNETTKSLVYEAKLIKLYHNLLDYVTYNDPECWYSTEIIKYYKNYVMYIKVCNELFYNQKKTNTDIRKVIKSDYIDEEDIYERMIRVQCFVRDIMPSAIDREIKEVENLIEKKCSCLL